MFFFLRADQNVSTSRVTLEHSQFYNEFNLEGSSSLYLSVDTCIEDEIINVKVEI